MMVLFVSETMTFVTLRHKGKLLLSLYRNNLQLHYLTPHSDLFYCAVMVMTRIQILIFIELMVSMHSGAFLI